MSLSERPRDVYTPVMALPSCDMRSECPNFTIREIRLGDTVVCIAYCKFLNRHLTRSSAKKCVELWRSCPFFSLSMSS